MRLRQRPLLRRPRPRRPPSTSPATSKGSANFFTTNASDWKRSEGRSNSIFSPGSFQKRITRRYAAAWKTYHHLQLLGSYWLLGGSILVAGIILPQLGLDRAAGVIAVVWFGGWFLVFASSRWRLLYFRCPRCNHRFHGGINRTKAEWCNHCRLRLYALSDPDAKTALR